MSGTMICGANNTGYGINSGELMSPDLFAVSAYQDLGDYQSTLAAPYDAANKVLRFANPEFPEGHYRYPNVGNEYAVRIPQAGGPPITVQGYKAHGRPEFRVRFTDSNLQAAFDAADKSSWVSGKVVDGAVGFWSNSSTNPADHPLSGEYVRPDGVPSGYMAGLKPGQVATTLVMDRPELPLPGGLWSTMANGTGTVELTVSRYDTNQDVVTTVSWVDGVPQGDPATLSLVAGTTYRVIDFGSGMVRQIRWRLTASDAAKPLHLYRLVMPGTWPQDGSADAGKTFARIYAEHRADPFFFLHHPAAIADRAVMNVTRELFTQQIIIGDVGRGYAGLRTAADRGKAHNKIGLVSGHSGSSESGGGVPWEILLKQGNAARNDLFWPFSHASDDSVVEEMGQLYLQLADRNLKLRPAHSCEVWNFVFMEWPAAGVWGSARFGRAYAPSITYDAGTGRATITKPGHGLSVGASIRVAGTEDSYDGIRTVVAATADTLTVAIPSAPAHAPAVPARERMPAQVWSTSDPGAVNITAVEWVLDYGVLGNGGLTSAIKVTTAGDNQIKREDIICLAGCAVPEVNGVWRAITESGYPANVALLHYDYQGLHAPVLPANVNPGPIAAKSGQSIQALVLSQGSIATDQNGQMIVPGMISIGEANARWHGHRSAEIELILYRVFADALDRLSPNVDLFIGGGGPNGFNRLVLDQHRKSLGGSLLPCVTTTAGPADYFVDYREPQRVRFVGDKKAVQSASVANGVVTVTCGFDPPDESNPDVQTQAHGWSTGDAVNFHGAADARLVGKWTITVVGPNQFTFPAPAGVADGPVGASSSNAFLFAVRNSQIGAEITGIGRSGSTVTYQVPGHPFSVGNPVGVDALATPPHNGAFVVSAVTANSVSLVVPPGAAFDPQFTYIQRAWMFRLSPAHYVGESASEALDFPGRLADHQDATDLCRSGGYVPSLYEWGVDGKQLAWVADVGWVLGMLKAGQRVPAMGDAYRKAMDLFAGFGYGLIAAYDLCGGWTRYGLWGLKDPQNDATSAKWPAFLEKAGGYNPPKRQVGPSAGFRITPPAARRIDEPATTAALGPTEIVSAPVTYSLALSGQGTVTPSTLSWLTGQSGPRPFTVAAASPGQTLTATPSNNLGEVLSFAAVTLDPNGNPGNATVVLQDAFNRADGPAGLNWLSIFNGAASDKAKVSGNALVNDLTYPRAVAYAATAPIANVQVVVDLLPDPGGANVTHDIHFRADPSTGRAYVVRFDRQSQHVAFLWCRGPFDYAYLGPSPIGAVADATATYRVVCKLTGSPGRFVGWITNLATGVQLGSWDFVVPATAYGDPGAAVTPITAPGVVGLTGDNPSPAFDNFAESRLDFASSLALAGPATVAAGGTATFLLSTVGGPALAPVAVTFSDGAGGGFEPAAATIGPTDYAPIAVRYTPAGAPGPRIVAATASPTLGPVAVASIAVGAAPPPDPAIRRVIFFRR